MATDSIDDLIILAADKGIHTTVDALLRHFQSYSIRKLKYQILAKHHMDSDCYRRAHIVLQPFVKQFRFAMVFFDRKDCCGKNPKQRESIERDVEERLFQNGWQNRAICIALDPELEIWVWSQSPEVEKALGWTGKTPPLRQWLVDRKFIAAPNEKPSDPKKAYEEALNAVGKQPSSSFFQQIASTVSLDRCADPAFLKLKSTLQSWFADETAIERTP